MKSGGGTVELRYQWDERWNVNLSCIWNYVSKNASAFQGIPEAPSNRIFIYSHLSLS